MRAGCRLLIKECSTAGADVELRYERRPQQDTDKTDVFYRKADVVRKDNKHFFCVRDHMGAFDPANWDESHVHMEEPMHQAATSPMRSRS